MLARHAKHRLYTSFKQAGAKPIADWLFTRPLQAFHHGDVLTAVSFEHAIAVHGSKVVNMGDGVKAEPPQTNAPLSEVCAGRDLLLVPAGRENGRVVGYTFGGMTSGKDASEMVCAFGRDGNVFLPHLVGRFSYDADLQDVLIVVHGLAAGSVGVMHVRGGVLRERSWYALHGGQYGFRRLPAKLYAMETASETRVAAPGVVQFSQGGAEMGGTMRGLEDLLKGRFVTERLSRTEMDRATGKVVSRVTWSAEESFDGKSPIGLQIFKDVFARLYYSYMSKVMREGDGSDSQRSQAGADL